MKYIDRKGNITIEENEQDKFLRHLYNDRGGRLCLKLLIRPFVSKAAGVLLNTRLSARFVPDFVKNNKIDLSIYEKQNFSSWNDFFIRRIRKEERPIDMRENILISPCDGKLSVHRISSYSRFSIKDTEYTAGQLLNIAGVKASFVLTQYNNEVYISARAIDEVNVQVMMEKMGGGGHMNIAGAQVKASPDEVERMLKDIIDQEYQEENTK